MTPSQPTQSNPSTAQARVLVDEMLRHGITDAVLCPGSRSAPLALAMAAAERAGRLRLHVRIDERGAGFTALGLSLGSKRPVPVVVTSGTAVANLHPAMLEAARDADLVIGSRYVRGGSVVNWPLSRKAISMGGNLYIRAILGMPVNDATAGYRVYRADTLREIGLHQVESAGYVFQTDLTVRTVRAGMRVVEVPITFVEREIGESKMDGDVVKESMRRITGWGVRHRRDQAASLLHGERRWHRL